MLTTQTQYEIKKKCDDSCVGPECSHLLCHDGESNGTGLVQCEGCSLRFCIPHLTETELSIFLCADCLADQKESDAHSDVSQLARYREIEANSEVL